MPRIFHTDFQYVDRESKAEYVWQKYQSVLQGHLLDVGSDNCYLRDRLPSGVSYTGIGLGGNPDLQVDLERQPIPFEDGQFDCVLCLDVLEHLDNIHAVFDELCRVSRRYVIVSLPNPWGDFYNMLRFGDYRPGQPLKFYGLPVQPPQDRHKWFFSSDEAHAFISHRSAANKMAIVQIDHEGLSDDTGLFRAWLRRLARNYLFPLSSPVHNLYRGTLWAVLEKQRGD